jgi:hypothetical protein
VSDDVVNLNRFRKKTMREKAAAAAAGNRAKFGRTRGEKIRDTDAAERRERLLDGAKRDKQDEEKA